MKKYIIIGLMVLGLASPSFAQMKQATPQEMGAVLKQIEKQTAELRGLPFKNEVNYKTMPKSDLIEYLTKKFREEATAEEMRNNSRAFGVLGLLPEGFDYEKQMLVLLEEQVGAFYDPDTHALYTFTDMEVGATFQKVLLAHELVHALQDQHFELAKFPHMKMKDNDDEVRAFQALIEGDATIIMAPFLMKSITNPMALLPELIKVLNMKTDALDAAPPYLRDTLTFPYTYGEKFATALYTATKPPSYDLINKAYRDLPLSTEQVLHPEKYLVEPDKRDNPKPVNIKKINSPNWTLLANNVLGEFSIRLLFATHLNPPQPATAKPKGLMEKLANPMQQTPIPPQALAAAEGWGGDRYHVYGYKTTKQNAGNEPLALWWATRWDSEEDALEFSDLLQEVFPKRYESLQVKEEKVGGARVVTLENKDWRVQITRKGDAVTIVQAPPSLFGEFAGLVANAAK